jgi:hypothetical protein
LTLGITKELSFLLLQWLCVYVWMKGERKDGRRDTTVGSSGVWSIILY